MTHVYDLGTTCYPITGEIRSLKKEKSGKEPRDCIRDGSVARSIAKSDRIN